MGFENSEPLSVKITGNSLRKSSLPRIVYSRSKISMTDCEVLAFRSLQIKPVKRCQGGDEQKNAGIRKKPSQKTASKGGMLSACKPPSLWRSKYVTACLSLQFSPLSQVCLLPLFLAYRGIRRYHNLVLPCGCY